MRNMPRIYRSFEEFERDELKRVHDDLGIDEMLDELFADELDIDFKAKRRPPSGVRQ